MIPNTSVDIITQNTTAKMLCCLRTGISFYQSLSFLKPVFGLFFIYLCFFAGYSDSRLKHVAYERRRFYNLSTVS